MLSLFPHHCEKTTVPLKSVLLSAISFLLWHHSVFTEVFVILLSSVILVDFNHMNCPCCSFLIYLIQPLLYSLNPTLQNNWNLPFRTILPLKSSVQISYFLLQPPNLSAISWHYYIYAWNIKESS